MALYKRNRAAYLLYVNGKRVMHFIGLNFSLNPKIVTWSTYGLFRTVNIEFIKQRGWNKLRRETISILKWLFIWVRAGPARWDGMVFQTSRDQFLDVWFVKKCFNATSSRSKNHPISPSWASSPPYEQPLKAITIPNTRFNWRWPLFFTQSWVLTVWDRKKC